MTDTKDILFVVLSVGSVWITAFLCWALYELATFLRRSNKIVDDVQHKIRQVEDTATAIKEKLINPLSYMGLLAGGGKSLFSMFKKRQAKQLGKKSKKAKKSDLYDDAEEE